MLSRHIYAYFMQIYIIFVFCTIFKTQLYNKKFKPTSLFSKNYYLCIRKTINNDNTYVL